MGNQELIKEALKAIADARAAGYNVLSGDISLAGLSEWHIPVVETVTMDPDPANGDVYIQKDDGKDEKKRFAISRQGLSKLNIAAGVNWDANHTRRTDKRTHWAYVSFQAVGGIQKPDGTWAMMKAEYDLDLEVVEEELIEQYTKKAKYLKKGEKPKERAATDKEKAEYIDFCVRRDMLQKRKHKLKLCESGAKDRVTRELLGIRATYSLEQIKKPFVVLRITVRPDYSDKDVKKAMLAAAISSMTGIYGGGAPQQIGYDSASIIDVTESEIPEEPESPEHPEPVAPAPADDPFSPKQESPVYDETDFKNSDPEDQVKTLREMIKRKGQREENLNRPLEKQSRTELLGLFNWLKDQPDKVAA